MIEKYLIEHCAPTLASLKTANLFTYHLEAEEDISNYLDIWNSNFKDKGIELILLKKQKGFALIYVCRKARLQHDLNKEGVAEFLAEYGYENTDVNYAINRLKMRLSQYNSFPHEIGIFLDYPLGDVIGFIDNAGENCKCTGCWKVYCNECEAVRTFAKYKKCREVYTRLWSEEKRNIMQLTVAV
ncbi:MAG: DUF3793 family protein [Eubacterium sp.]|nr:DUF3793 family protein [Eubacterium sp.]